MFWDIQRGFKNTHHVFLNIRYNTIERKLVVTDKHDCSLHLLIESHLMKFYLLANAKWREITSKVKTHTMHTCYHLKQVSQKERHILFQKEISSIFQLICIPQIAIRDMLRNLETAKSHPVQVKAKQLQFLINDVNDS